MTDEEAIKEIHEWVESDGVGKISIASLSVALDALRERIERKNGGWISVKDRLPERPPDYFKEGHWWMVSGEDFIVADADGKVYEAHWTYGCSANNYFWYVNSLTPLKNITHWMPLPKPPEQEEAKDGT